MKAQCPASPVQNQHPLKKKYTPLTGMDLTPPPFFVPGQNFYNSTMKNYPDGLILDFKYTIYKKERNRQIIIKSYFLKKCHVPQVNFLGD